MRPNLRMKSKYCPICKKEFAQNTNNQIYCIPCGKVNQKKLTQIWKNNNKEELIEYRKNWYVKFGKEYYRKNKIEIKKSYTKYYKNHKQQISDKGKIYREKHRVEISKRMKIVNKKRLPITLEIQRIRLKTDINFKLIRYLRSRIWHALKGNYKSKTTMKLVGCSIEKLKQHLESQFKEGMTFSNYGKWHIDHIRPCTSFDLSKLDEQYKCFHYTNLQPLWAEENLRKSSSYDK